LLISQALFHTGLIPGETDFRIYRDFGNIPGADFAVLTNGWVYHTWRDDLAHLDFRSVQRYGESWQDDLSGEGQCGEKAGVLRYVTRDIARLHNCLEVFAAYHDHPSHQTILLHEFDGTVSRLSVSSPNIVGGPCDSYDRFLFQCP